MSEGLVRSVDLLSFKAIFKAYKIDQLYTTRAYEDPIDPSVFPGDYFSIHGHVTVLNLDRSVMSTASD